MSHSQLISKSHWIRQKE